MTVLTLVCAASTEGVSHSAEEAGSFGDSLLDEGLSRNTVLAYLSDVTKYGVTSRTSYEQHVAIAARIVQENSAASTRMRRLSALAKFHAYVHPGEADNPYRKVRRPTQGVVLPGVVSTQDEARAIIATQRKVGTVASLRLAAAVSLMAGAGLRVAEVCNLRFCDVNPKGKTLRVTDGKGGKTRDVPMSEFVLEVLGEYVLRAHSEHPAPGDRLIPCSTRTIQRDVRSASLAEDEGRALNPHAFRHGFATAVYRNTTDLLLTADILGHASVATSQVYVHLADDRRSEAVSAAL